MHTPLLCAFLMRDPYIECTLPQGVVAGMEPGLRPALAVRAAAIDVARAISRALYVSDVIRQRMIGESKVGLRGQKREAAVSHPTSTCPTA